MSESLTVRPPTIRPAAKSTQRDHLRQVEPERQAVIYLRVSSKRQMDTAADIDPEGNSIATQREMCAAKAERMGARVVKEFVEPGNSAQTIEKRPIFRELLAYLTENPHIDYLIIYLRSRAFRNLGDAVLTKRRLERMDIKLMSAKEDFGEGIMADAMEAVTDIINEVQVRMSGEDIKLKMRHKAENGGTISRARLGYKNIRIEHEGRMVNTIGLDDERAALVRMAWEVYATGEYTIERLYTTMADQGLTTRPSRRTPAQPLAASQLHRMLSDPYYTGVVVYRGETFAGRHPAIVSQQLFDRVQQVLEMRSSRGQRDRVLFHYLKGLLFCDRCRRAGRTSRLIYVEAKGRNGTTHRYFLCRGRQDKFCDLPYLPVALVEDAVVRFYPSLKLDDEFTAETAGVIEQTMADEQRIVRELHATSANSSRRWRFVRSDWWTLLRMVSCRATRFVLVFAVFKPIAGKPRLD
ncbi:MAG: recombinase family protein [Nocardioidaceae bacterium]